MSDQNNKPKPDSEKAKTPDPASGTSAATPAAPAPATAAAPNAPVDLVKVIPELKKQQEELQIQVNSLQTKIQMLEQAFHENDLLRTECANLIQEYKELYSQDWKRKEEYFPDIYLNYRNKIAERLKK